MVLIARSIEPERYGTYYSISLDRTSSYALHERLTLARDVDRDSVGSAVTTCIARTVADNVCLNFAFILMPLLSVGTHSLTYLALSRKRHKI